METPDIPFDDVDEYIPDDGFEHVSMNMDCPCNPDLKFIPGVGGGMVHRSMAVGDTFPSEWNNYAR